MLNKRADPDLNEAGIRAHLNGAQYLLRLISPKTVQFGVIIARSGTDERSYFHPAGRRSFLRSGPRCDAGLVDFRPDPPLLASAESELAEPDHGLASNPGGLRRRYHYRLR